MAYNYNITNGEADSLKNRWMKVIFNHTYVVATGRVMNCRDPGKPIETKFEAYDPGTRSLRWYIIDQCIVLFRREEYTKLQKMFQDIYDIVWK